MAHEKEHLHLAEAWLSGRVQRCHTRPTIGDASVASHSWGMAVLAYVLYKDEEPETLNEIVKACLTHDMPELHTGDTPRVAKDATPGLAEQLHKAEERILSERPSWPQVNLEYANPRTTEALTILDILEYLMFAAHQTYLGNRYYEGDIIKCRTALCELDMPSNVQEFVEAICGKSSP